MPFPLYGVPGNFNSWGERRSSEHLLLKQRFGTCVRSEPARKSLQRYCFFLIYANIFLRKYVFSSFFFFLLSLFCFSGSDIGGLVLAWRCISNSLLCANVRLSRPSHRLLSRCGIFLELRRLPVGIKKAATSLPLLSFLLFQAHPMNRSYLTSWPCMVYVLPSRRANDIFILSIYACFLRCIGMDMIVNLSLFPFRRPTNCFLFFLFKALELFN